MVNNRYRVCCFEQFTTNVEIFITVLLCERLINRNYFIFIIFKITCLVFFLNKNNTERKTASR